jgi:hypothetical protein
MRNGVARLHRGMVPPEVVLIEGTLGLVDAKSLAVVAELGVADELADGPRTAADVAERVGADADALGRVLRYLVGRGFFRTTRDGRYRNNKRSDLLRDAPDSMRAWARFYGSRWHLSIWNELEHSVRTGGSATQAGLGHPFWEYLTDVDTDAGELFDAAMASTSSVQVDLVATKYPFRGRVCDVGGGTGTVLAAILREHPDAKGVLYDLPSVVARSAPVLEAADVADRVEVVGGSFFDGVPPDCDAYVMQAIVHDWDDDSCVTFLTHCRAAMAPDGRVLVVEALVPDHDGDHFIKAVDLEMLVDTGAGRERTREQFDALFARAGLEIEKRIPIAVSNIFVLRPQLAP